MAVAKKCDICGKLYDAYGCNDNEKNPNGIMLTNVTMDGSEYYKHKVKDLCPECMDALKAFMRERGWVEE